MSKPIERQCPDCLRRVLFRGDQKGCGCKRRGEVQAQTQAQAAEVSEVAGDQWTISLPKSRIHTLEELIEYFQVDTGVWEVERFVCNKWEMGAKDANDTVQIHPLFQVKAWLKRKVHVADAKREIEELREFAKQVAPPPRRVVRQDKLPRGNMLEIDLSDHHFAKLAWSEETGHANYDLKEAVRVWWDAFDSILARSSSHKFDEIWLVVGNDLLNSDNTDSRTTKGTYVNSDTRYQKSFTAVRKVMIESIERLREVCNKVKVIMVSGNHDHLSVWHLGDSLESYFHKYPDVEIDNSPRYFKYHEYGSVMVLYTHGDKGKRTDYPLLMATEQPEMFGRTRYREVHVGHRHQEKIDEFHGVKVRQFSSLSPPDAWHAENAFVGNLRTAQGLIWNKDEGLIGTVIYTESEDKVGAKVG